MISEDMKTLLERLRPRKSTLSEPKLREAAKAAQEAAVALEKAVRLAAAAGLPARNIASTVLRAAQEQAEEAALLLSRGLGDK